MHQIPCYCLPIYSNIREEYVELYLCKQCKCPQMRALVIRSCTTPRLFPWLDQEDISNNLILQYFNFSRNVVPGAYYTVRNMTSSHAKEVYICISLIYIYMKCSQHGIFTLYVKVLAIEALSLIMLATHTC